MSESKNKASGKYMTTITIDKNIWKKFTIAVIEKYGSPRFRAKVIEDLIKEYLQREGYE